MAVPGLSRITDDVKAKTIVEGLADGSVDIFIGTYRLQQNIRCKDLRLVVVKEKAAVGDEHTEHITAASCVLHSIGADRLVPARSQIRWIASSRWSRSANCAGQSASRGEPGTAGGCGSRR